MIEVSAELVECGERDEVNSSHRRYVRHLGGLTLMILLGIASINICVDPYLRFGTPRYRGFNDVKPAAIKQVRMAKAYEVLRNDYRTLLMGNSRVDVGIDPGSPWIPEVLGPVYNLSQPGTGSESTLLYLKHAATQNRLSRVLVGVDFLSFLEEPDYDLRDSIDSPPLPEQGRLLSTERDGFTWTRKSKTLHDALVASLSLTALDDSVFTIIAQRDPYSANISPSGFNAGEAFRSLIHLEGQRALFHQKNNEYAARCLRRVAPDHAISSELEAINDILTYCKEYEIRVDLFIHPYHADVLEIIAASDHWAAFEQWKQKLVAICGENESSLWDFSGYDDYTTESPPKAEDRETVMQWYWESGHYRSTLGELVLQRIMTDNTDAEFGKKLSAEMLPQHLVTIRAERERYREISPDQERVRKLVDRLRLSEKQQ